MSLIADIGFLLSIPLFFGYGIYWLVRRGYQMKALVERGESGTARIVRKQRFRGMAMKQGSKRLVYEFRGPDGRPYQGRFMASDEEFSAAEPGQEIAIVYLPDRPAVHARRALVEQTRLGFAGKPGRTEGPGESR